jgi:hypothetical protein
MAARGAPALVGAVCGAAFGQTESSSPAGDGLNAAGRSPFYYGASVNVTHDSNVFRDSKGTPETADTYTTLSLQAGIDKPIGRQRVRASAEVNHSTYQDLSELDNTGYSLGAGLDWQTIEKLSGTLGVVAKQSLARYGIESAPATTDKNVEKGTAVDATIQYGGESILTAYGLYGYRTLDYSLPQFKFLDYERNEVGAGLRYRVSGALRVGVEAKYSTGKYPNFRANGSGGFDADDFDRRDLALTTDWDPSGASHFRARIAASRQNRDIGGDFSGVTGSLGWEWRPTGKLRFDTELRRDVGQEVNPIVESVVNAVGDNSRVTNALEVRARYEATAKIRFDMIGRYARRSLVDTLTAVNVPGAALSSAGSDATTYLRLGVQYDVLRRVTVGCGVAREDRSSDSTVSSSYRDTATTCFARLLLQ